MPGVARQCQELPKLLLIIDRCSPDSHFHVGASEAKRSEAERGHSNSIGFTCFDSVGHFLAYFSVFQYLNALPVPMVRQVYFSSFSPFFKAPENDFKNIPQNYTQK